MNIRNTSKTPTFLIGLSFLAWIFADSGTLLAQKQRWFKRGTRVCVDFFESHDLSSVKRSEFAQDKNEVRITVRQQSHRLSDFTFADALRVSSTENDTQTRWRNPVFEYTSFEGEENYRSQTSLLVLIPVGLLSAGIGYLGGGFLAFAISPECEGAFCGLDAFIIGAMAGGTLTIPFGVHMANKKQGEFGLDLLASLIAGGAGLLLSIEEPENLITVPLFQITAAITTEKLTSANH